MMKKIGNMKMIKINFFNTEYGVIKSDNYEKLHLKYSIKFIIL